MEGPVPGTSDSEGGFNFLRFTSHLSDVRLTSAQLVLRPVPLNDGHRSDVYFCALQHALGLQAGSW